MHVLAIDVGSYSVKYISSIVEKRKINHLEMSEIVLADFIEDHPQTSSADAQSMIIQEIIESVAKPDTRVVYQINNELMTTRFLTLPVKSKKKAELMLPFQLEEDIPFSLSEIHYAYRMESIKSQHLALVGLLKEPVFEANYNNLREKQSLPSILTTEASTVENYFNQNVMAGALCVLDLGHKTTKAYFFYNSRLIVTHVSYVGGHDINEMISKTYKIDADEAVIYKHQNAFLLTESMYAQVDQPQRDFATAMDKTLGPLVSDFNRWKIGLKVNFGLTLQHVYIIGGTSNIRNMATYLTEKLETKVFLLESFDKVESTKIDLDPKNKSKFALTNMMTIGMKRKNRFINLLTGKFAQASGSEIPLHSFAFLGIRVSAVAIIILISLVAERFFIQKDIKFVDAKLSILMKDDALGINGRLRRAMAVNPKPVFDSLVKRQRGIRQEVSTMQSAISTKGLAPLVYISQLAAATQVTLTEFKASDIGEISATFTSETPEELTNLKAILERSNLSDINVDLDTTKLSLKLTAAGE